MIPCFEDLTQKSFCGWHYGNDWSNSLTLNQLIGYDLLFTGIIVGSILGTLFFFIKRENSKQPTTEVVK